MFFVFAVSNADAVKAASRGVRKIVMGVATPLSN